jgi:hypothetical protein
MEQAQSEVKYFDNVDDYIKALQLLILMPNNFNRPIKFAHAKKMAESVRRYGITRTVIAIKTKCFGGKFEDYCGDAQHLMHAIIHILEPHEISGTLSIQTYEMKDKDEIIPFISRLNTTAKTWSKLEFLNIWCAYGTKDYLQLRDIVAKTKHNLPKILEIYSGRRTDKVAESFKDGTWKIDLEYGNGLMSFYESAVACGLYRSKTTFVALTRIVIDWDGKISRSEILEIINKDRKIFKDSKNSREDIMRYLRSAIKNKLNKKKTKVVITAKTTINK